MRRFYLIGILVLVLANRGFSQSKTPGEAFPWLVGTWEMKVRNGTLYEAWFPMPDGSLQSKGYKVTAKGDTVLLEAVRMTFRNDSYYYTSTVPDQNNRQPVPFKITSLKTNGFVAENPDHDFPQRIAYELRNDGQLFAYIDGKDKGQYQKSEFTYRRVMNASGR